ncbi:hypothetical protein [Carboxylicivirga sp. RSCT41]|uniref:hypothetical protein n=1 Tax=Carboxylicivirga agarovorans TaxID=3417570 RepID=UPI003D333A5F
MFGFRIIDLIRGTKTVPFFKRLKDIQFNDSDFLTQQSERSLKDLWEEVKGVDYYSGFNDLKDLPVLSKDLIKKEPSRFLNNEINRKNWIRKKTGGSTGIPFVYYTSKKSQSYLWAGILLSWDAAGWKPDDKIVFLAGSSIIGRGWKQKIYYRLMNVIPLDSFDMSSTKMNCYLNILKNKKIRFVYGYANAIYHLAKYNIEHDVGVKLQSVISTAENLKPIMRKTIEDSFDCEVFNQYGCNDAGLSAFECNKHKGLHVINSRAHIEVINEELISTDLANNVMPMIRYNSGDRVQLSTNLCECGRGFPLIKEIYGRSNDIIRNAETGAIIHSEFFNHLFREDSEIYTYQIKVNPINIHINIITIEKTAKKVQSEDFYLKIIAEKTGYKSVTVNYNKELMTSENGKVKTIINEEL